MQEPKKVSYKILLSLSLAGVVLIAACFIFNSIDWQISAIFCLKLMIKPDFGSNESRCFIVNFQPDSIESAIP